jgi:ubiquinone/menaquinone biosynthesis C-methylase UbiE
MPFSLGPREAPAYLSTLLGPAPMLDLLGAVAFRAAGAAVRLGVFESLGDRTRTAGELAEAIGATEPALGLLLDVLVSSGYLTRTADGYANSPSTRKWLRRDTRPSFLPALVMWQDLVFELWADLESTVREGKPAVDFYQWLESRPGQAADFQKMLGLIADALSEDVLPLVPVPSEGGSLIDIGGGHAKYSVAFCRRHPELQATVVDLPEALSAGRESVLAAGMSSRIALREADIYSDDLGGGHDVALLFKVLHSTGPERNAALLRKVYSALRPGGVVAVLEQLTDAESITDPDSVADEAFVRAFSLNLFHTQGGQVYSRDDIDGLLTRAGFETPSWSTLRKSATDHIAVAVKPGARNTDG